MQSLHLEVRTLPLTNRQPPTYPLNPTLAINVPYQKPDRGKSTMLILLVILLLVLGGGGGYYGHSRWGYGGGAGVGLGTVLLILLCVYMLGIVH
jgi:hypothetical protein